MKKAIITGASSGLGKEIANCLEKEEVTIINLSRNKTAFEDIYVDLSDNALLSKAIQDIKNIHSDFDLLILNAAIMPIEDLTKINKDIDAMFKINSISMIKIINELFDLIKKNNADIIIIGSTAALEGTAEHPIYCATKHAVDGLIKSLQKTVKHDNVRVIGFHPGGFNSNLRGGAIKEGYMDPKDLAKILVDIIRLPRSIEVSQIVLNKKIVKKQ